MQITATNVLQRITVRTLPDMIAQDTVVVFYPTGNIKSMNNKAMAEAVIPSAVEGFRC